MAGTEYRTEKLGTAAYLVAMGSELPTVRGVDGRDRTRCEFIFPDPEGGVEWTSLEYDVNDENAAMVSAPRFYNALRTLHRLMGEARGQAKDVKQRARR